MKSTEVAWAAGMFEGEGTISLSKPQGTNYCSLTVHMVNTDEGIVRFFVEHWGGSVYAGKPTKRNHKPWWRWTAGSRKALRFLVDVYPYLHTEKYRERAQVAMEFQLQKIVGGRKDPQYKDKQMRLHERMRLLNVRGVGGV